MLSCTILIFPGTIGFLAGSHVTIVFLCLNLLTPISICWFLPDGLSFFTLVLRRRLGTFRVYLGHIFWVVRYASCTRGLGRLVIIFLGIIGLLAVPSITIVLFCPNPFILIFIYWLLPDRLSFLTFILRRSLEAEIASPFYQAMYISVIWALLRRSGIRALHSKENRSRGSVFK
jgi:hypothetical protein